MAQVDPNRHRDAGNQKPALRAAEFGDVDAAVLTVESYREIELDNRTAGVMEFREFPEHMYWVNASGVRRLCERFGNDSDDWIGQSVPLMRVRTRNPRTDELVDSFHVAPIEEWDEILDQYHGRRRPRKAAPKRKQAARVVRKRRKR